MRHMRTHTTLARVAAVVAGTLATGLAVVVLAPAAGAATGPTAHDPFGAHTAFAATSGGVLATGWAADRDDLTSNITVFAIVDGKHVSPHTVTLVKMPVVAMRNGTGATPGYSLVVPLTSGAHIVCIGGQNILRGSNTVLGCVATPLGRSLSSSQTAARSPRGAVTGFSAGASTVRYRGWSADPDYVNRRLLAVLYIDGSPAKTVLTSTSPTPTPTGAGQASAFDITVPVSSGSHLGCIWIVNVGLGANTFLGCHAVDTRGAPATGTLPSPAVNKAVVTEAKKHIGQDYVFGAVGPKTFDCSGLVLYSYTKAQNAADVAHPVAVQRVSEAQAVQARLIPASRAVPGDLVFTHDTEGDVYHVGIYIKPGLALAAIDYGYGVNYQNIWDPSSTTYGSLTHT